MPPAPPPACLHAADYRDDAETIGERLAYTHRAARKRWNFEKSERAVPISLRLGARDLSDKRIGGLRSDVEAHDRPSTSSTVCCVAPRFQDIGDRYDRTVVNTLDVLASGFGDQFLRQLDFVAFDARSSAEIAILLSLEERVRHRAADQDRIDFVEQIFDQPDFVGDLRAAHDCDRRPLRILRDLPQSVGFAHHQESRRALLREIA